MSTTEVSAQRIAMMNAILRDHSHGHNKYMLGGDQCPTFTSGKADGSIMADMINRDTGESVVTVNSKKEDKGPTFHMITGPVVLTSSWLDVRRSIEKAISEAKKTGKKQKDSNQSITFALSPTDERLVSSQQAMDDLKQCFTSDLTEAWYNAGYKPTKALKQAANLEEYDNEMMKSMMQNDISPYVPLVETERDGEFVMNFKASSKFTPYGTDTRKEHAEIARAAGGDILDFMEDNPDKRIQFIELLHADGRKVQPSEYWEMIDTAFGPGSICIATLMCAYGGVINFEGTKTSVQPKLVALQEVERVAGPAAGGSGGACNLIEALAKFESAEQATAAESDDEAAGEKRKQKQKKLKSAKKGKTADE